VTEQPWARKTILTVTDDFSGYTKDIPATINIYLTATATKAVATATVKVIEMPFNLVFFKTDHLGTPRVITDQDGKVLSNHDYLAYGEEITTADFQTNRMKFTGHERDPETGLDYMLARYYTAGSGRFLQVDPGYDYDPMDPMSFNLYGYVRGNPVMGTDPTGMVLDYSLIENKEEREFVKKSIQTLKDMDPDGAGKMITALDESKNIHYITLGSGNSNEATPPWVGDQPNKEKGQKDVELEDKKKPSGTLTTIRESLLSVPDEPLDSKGSERGNIFTSLAHELWHAYDRDCGRDNQSRDGRRRTELGAEKMENRIRPGFGLNKRNHYFDWKFSAKELDSPIDWKEKK